MEVSTIMRRTVHKLWRMVDLDAFRSEFPVLSHSIYLNTGTDGPVPTRAASASAAAVAQEVADGRAGRPHFEKVLANIDAMRSRIARLWNASDDDIALTRSATDGVNIALNALRFEPGDDVITTDEEHPGILAPLAVLKARHGVTVRTVPWDEIAAAVKPETKLVACSHVSWVSGRLIDVDGLKATGVPVLLDGAQGAGAIKVDVEELGCDFYAAAGQKWLCGPDGSGYLYVNPERCAELLSPWPSYLTMEDPLDPLTSGQKAGARRFDMGVVPAALSSWALTSFDVFDERGWDWVTERGPEQTAKLAVLLAERGLAVVPRGPSTLVSWHVEDNEAEVARLAAENVMVRYLPARGLVRASVGAWVTDDELVRVADLAAATS
jgi:L-cysteine/cystine lyase